jgi:hypothetical protein
MITFLIIICILALCIIFFWVIFIPWTRWGSTPEERAMQMTCDSYLDGGPSCNQSIIDFAW